MQEVIPKGPPGHVRYTHLFTLSRPGRAAVPWQVRKRFPGTANPPTLRSAVCGGRFPAAELRSWVGAAASAGGAAGDSSLSLAPTSGRGDCGRTRAQPGRPPGCCSAALRRPLPAPAPRSPREAASGCRVEHPFIYPPSLHPRHFSLASTQFPASGFSQKDLFPWLKPRV